MPAPVAKPLHTDGSALRRADGKHVILRGVNARVAGVFDVTFDDGRQPLEPIPDFTAEDAAEARRLGFNVLRLPVNWSGLEPKSGEISTSYLDRVAAIVEVCRKAGIYVLLDMHQDAWSKEIGEDGTPLWAIQPPPDMLLGGPLTDLGDRRTSQQVMRAFKGFFEENRGQLQEHFADTVAALATRFKDDDAVIGFEIMNEPLTTQDALDAFHFKVAKRLRQVTDKLVFFEPNSTRNFIDSAPQASAPFPEKDVAYAPHVYTLAFSDPKNELATVTYERLALSVRNARDEAMAWGTPLFVGEFGIGPTQTNWDKWLQFEYDAQDEVLASSALWLWKEQSQGSWGLFDFDSSTGKWSERAAYAATVMRGYVQAAGGDLVSMKYDPVTRTLEYEVQRRAHVAPVDEVYFPTPPDVQVSVTCDGVRETLQHFVVGPMSVRCGDEGMHRVGLRLGG
jgi:endoglycosylceramidase